MVVIETIDSVHISSVIQTVEKNNNKTLTAGAAWREFLVSDDSSRDKDTGIR